MPGFQHLITKKGGAFLRRPFNLFNRSNPPGGYDFVQIAPLPGSKALPASWNPGCPTASCEVSTGGQDYDTMLPCIFGCGLSHLCAGRDGVGVGGVEEDGVAFGVGGGHQHSLGL